MNIGIGNSTLQHLYSCALRKKNNRGTFATIFAARPQANIPLKTNLANLDGILAINLKDATNKCNRYIDYPKPMDFSIKKTFGQYVVNPGYDKTRFRDSLKPTTLSVSEFPKKTMHISNFDAPSGSIAISTALDGTISTDKLYQCAAVSIVDRKNNLQTLFHCHQGETAKENRVILDYILSHSKNSNPEITIIPGCYLDTDITISFLVDNIKDILGKNYKINFANIVNNNKCIVLKNGLLTCTKINRRLSESEINPINKIIFNSSIYKIENDKIKYIAK